MVTASKTIRTHVSLGRVVMTPAANETLTAKDIYAALARHRSGDWGTVCKADQTANDTALKYGGRLLSAYTNADDEKFWIITEADRSYTTILLPEDY